MQLSLTKLFADNQQQLLLTSCFPLEEHHVIKRRHGQYASELVGHFNRMHPQRIQVIGKEEWKALSSDSSLPELASLIQESPPALIVSDQLSPSPVIENMCKAYKIPLLYSGASAAGVIDILYSYLARRLADIVTMSGVMLDVLGLGTLITGESGLGKSELGLELITRGHGLVADDVTELARVAPYTLESRCPEMLRDFIEVRGLGILNVRLIFGETAIRRKMKLKLIVNLIHFNEYQYKPRLPEDEEEHILGVPIRRVNLPVSAGRNLAVLIEAAVRHTILKLRGFNSSSELIRRHAEQLYSPLNPLPEPDSECDNE